MKNFFKETFTWHKLFHLIVSETIGKFFAFMIGMWSANLFTYQVLEKKDLHNLFGILHRKEIVVHTAPQWVELLFSTVIGFIAMELFHFLIHQINTQWIWERTKCGFLSLMGKNRD